MDAFSFINQTADDKVVANSELTVVISKELFDDGIAEITGDGIQTLGFFEIWVKKDSSGIKFDKFKVALPATVTLNFLDRREDSENIYIDYDKGMVIIEKMAFVKDVMNVLNFFNFLKGGKIAANSPGDLVKVFKENSSLNGIDLEAQSSLVEAMVSEMTRYTEDPGVPYRIALKTHKAGLKDFTFVNIKEIARLTSVFSAISFEDINKAIQASLDITRNKKKQMISPVEDVLKY